MSNSRAVQEIDLRDANHLFGGSFGRSLCRTAIGAAIFGAAAFPGLAQAQEATLTAAPLLKAALVVSEGLPNSPGYASVTSSSSAGDGLAAEGGAGQMGSHRAPSHFDKVVEPGQTVTKLTIPDKVLLGIRENATIGSVAGWVLSASYEQAVNSSPNYGQTGKGYAQRLGAAAARNVSENIFSDSIIAPILHEDPRYYRMGPGHNFFSRLVYSGTRGLITRTDGGRKTINFANIGGDLAGSAATQLYYPAGNRNFTQVMSTWGSSIGGDAVGYVANEFLSGFLTTMHLKSSNP